MRHIAKTDKATRTKLITGQFHSSYLVDAGDVHGAVDAYTGALQSISFDSRMPTTPDVLISAATAKSNAAAYLVANAISTTGLAASVTLVDHGSSQEYDINWERRVNGVLVPDRRLASVNPATGDLFQLTVVSYPYADPETPAISESQAIAAAKKVVGVATAQVESTDLLVWFDGAGSQITVWRIGLRQNGPVPSSTLVQVNAMTGSSSVVGRG